MNNQTEQDAAKIMQFLVINRGIYPEVARSEKNLSSILRIPVGRITAASIYLTGQGFARMRGIHIEADEAGDGERWLSGISDSPYFQTPDAAWKDEVLTGIKTTGDPTNIENPVLESGSEHAAPADFELRHVRMIDRLIMARQAGESLGVIEEKIKSGKSKVCKGYRRPIHLCDISEFYLNNGSPMTLCKACRKEKLRKEKSDEKKIEKENI